MMARRSFLSLALALGAALGVAGCVRTYIYRYRLTLAVETPQGVKTGSSVMECGIPDQTSLRWLLGDIQLTSAGFRGEAIAVDLGPRGALFALLSGPRGESDYALHLPQEVFIRRGVIRVTDAVKEREEAIMAHRGKVELEPAELPMLVRFRDINDPKTVEAVDPNDLAKSFGPGVRLKRATIEMTGDPVTTGIRSKLSWWDQLTVPIGGTANRRYGDPLYGIGKWNFARGQQ